MTILAKQDFLASVKCNGTVNLTIPAGLSTHFQDAQYMLFGCWVKPTTSLDGVNYRDFLIFRGDSGSNTFAGLFVDVAANRFGVAGLGAASSVFYAAQLNAWAHVIGEIDLVNLTRSLWIDGVLVAKENIVPARNLATVTSLASFIGDSASPGFVGHVAKPFIQRRNTPATQSEIDDLYTTGQYPKCEIGFTWPFELAVGTTAPCVDTNGRPSVIHDGFAAVLNTSTMWSRDIPMQLPIADRIGGNCIFLRSAANYYRQNTDKLYDFLNGASVIIISAWAKNNNPNTGAAQYIFDLTNPAGSVGLVLMKSASRAFEFGGRSVDADAYAAASCVGSAFDGMQIDAGRWMHYTGVFDFIGKNLYGYINGVQVCRNIGIATWATTTGFQVTRGGTAQIYIGHSTSFYPGFIDDVCVFRSDVVPRDAEIREYYLKGLNATPNAWRAGLILDMEDFGPNLIDKSGNGVDFDPISIAPPYGLFPHSYIP